MALRHRWPKIASRSVLAGILTIGAALFLIWFVNGIYPVRNWMLPTVLALWLWQLYLSAAFVVAGDLVVSRLFRLQELTALPRLALAAPTGAVVLTIGMFLGGFLGLFGPVFAVLWPALMIASGVAGGGGPTRWWNGRAWWGDLGRPTQHGTPVVVLATIFGMFSVALVYLGTFSPEVVNYDAAWSHLVVAQDYAREGRIVPFVANWPATLPHLASIFYTWGFLVPGLGQGAVRWMMALHTEFVFMLWTVVGVGAAVELVTERRVRGAWAAFFLFPGIFVYDNNLGAAADHVLAFFAAPALIAAIRGAETLKPGWWGLFGLIAAGGVLTKFQSAYYLLPGAALLAVAWARGLWNWSGRGARPHEGEGAGPPPDLPPVGRAVRGAAERGRTDARWAWLAPLAALGCLVVATAPHFIRNWVFYRNPVYPLAQQIFTGSRPSIPDAALLANNIISHWGTKPPSDLGARLLQAAELFWSFSFRPHAGFSGNIPVVGSLFTLTLPLVLVIAAGRRIQLTVALASAAVFLWAFTYWVDRNLQGFIPVLAIATCALLIRAWELGRVARLGVVALVGTQLTWSGDHFLNGNDRIGSALALIRSGYEGRAAERFADFRRPFVELGAMLPPEARVLMHSIHGSLGINREALLDWPGFQGLIDPAASRTPRELYDRYRALGVTHVVYRSGLHPSPVKQDEVIFGALRTQNQSSTRAFGPYRMFPLPPEPPAAEAPYKVLALGVGGYQDGIYRVEDLATMEGMPAHLQKRFSPLSGLIAGQVAAQLDDVQAVLLGSGVRLEQAAKAKLAEHFQQVVAYSSFELQVRR